MVNNMHLKALLEIEDSQERTTALRRAFAAYTQPLDITGHESSALIILLNLTYPRKLVDDLLDKRLAKNTVKNEDHLDSCIGEVQWLHSHNLKYPDIRVSKQRLIASSPQLHTSVLSSANCESSLGWSHDSAKVNFAKLFGSHFIWQGRLCCLASILSEAPQEWKIAFQALGMTVKHFDNLCGRVKGFLPKQTSPNNLDKYSIQVRMPYRDGYLAVTPVVSHALQAEIQQAALNKQGRYTNIEFTRPAAVSDLVASLGGNNRVLNYPPRTHKVQQSLSHSLQSKLSLGQAVLNQNALKQSRFTRALEGLLSNHLALALKQRRQQNIACHRQIRASLSEWLAPLLEWRIAVKENKESLDELVSIKDTLEYQFLVLSDEQLPELLSPLFSLLNIVLSHSNAANKYAFHQQLIIPLKNSLKWLLTHLANEENVHSKEDEDAPLQRYLYLKGIRVFDAQALSNPYCAGIPSLTAVWGMMHNYQRRLNERLGTHLRFTSFSWFIRHSSAVAGKKLPEFGMQGQKENQFRRSGITDNKYCDLVFDLIIHIDGYEEELQKLDVQVEMLKSSFPALFAGGVMHPPEIGSVDEWCELYTCEASLYSKLKRLPMSGKWIMPTRYSFKNLSELLFLLHHTSSLCPVMLGYLLLDHPETRAYSLEALHCYAEAAIGVVECATAIDIRLQGRSNFFKRAFWMLEVKDNSMLMKRI
jgi:CRISPR-associated protein Csy2